MSTLKPFILSSLALHFLGVGILLFLVVSPPAEVKTLTVVLVSEEQAYGGGRGEGKGNMVNKPSSRPRQPGTNTNPAGGNKLDQDVSPKTAKAVLAGGDEKDKNVTPANKNKMEGISASSGVQGTGEMGVAGEKKYSSAAGENRISGLSANGTGYGQGSGYGNGNGWGRGDSEHLYLKGGYQLTPAYPASARRRGHEGTTYLKIKISPEGKVLEVLIDQSSGHRDLDEAAAEAVKTWRFEPPQKGGQKVSLWARVPIKFQLRNK